MAKIIFIHALFSTPSLLTTYGNLFVFHTSRDFKEYFDKGSINKSFKLNFKNLTFAKTEKK